mmetsp:Transcript_458/g.1395  ORF Transcript_458/g.1395 Transcript_458/m.1395 type:complete len:204 (-) Transcript_458:343-954(-)
MRIGRDDSTVVERVPPASLRQRHLKRSPTSERGCARQPTPQRVRLCGSRQTHAGWWQARRVGRTHVAVAVAPAACAGLNHRQTRQRKRGQSQTLVRPHVLRQSREVGPRSPPEAHRSLRAQKRVLSESLEVRPGDCTARRKDGRRKRSHPRWACGLEGQGTPPVALQRQRCSPSPSRRTTQRPARRRPPRLERSPPRGAPQWR